MSKGIYCESFLLQCDGNGKIEVGHRSGCVRKFGIDNWDSFDSESSHYEMLGSDPLNNLRNLEKLQEIQFYPIELFDDKSVLWKGIQIINTVVFGFDLSNVRNGSKVLRKSGILLTIK
jgi:hypothetical protein